MISRRIYWHNIDIILMTGFRDDFAISFVSMRIYDARIISLGLPLRARIRRMHAFDGSFSVSTMFYASHSTPPVYGAAYTSFNTRRRQRYFIYASLYVYCFIKIYYATRRALYYIYYALLKNGIRE